MRMILSVAFPHEPFNTLVRKGTISKVMGKILDAIKPESAYFTEQDGTARGDSDRGCERAIADSGFGRAVVLEFQRRLQAQNCNERRGFGQIRLGCAGQEMGIRHDDALSPFCISTITGFLSHAAQGEISCELE